MSLLKARENVYVHARCIFTVPFVKRLRRTFRSQPILLRLFQYFTDICSDRLNEIPYLHIFLFRINLQLGTNGILSECVVLLYEEEMNTHLQTLEKSSLWPLNQLLSHLYLQHVLPLKVLKTNRQNSVSKSKVKFSFLFTHLVYLQTFYYGSSSETQGLFFARFFFLARLDFPAPTNCPWDSEDDYGYKWSFCFCLFFVVDLLLHFVFLKLI